MGIATFVISFFEKRYFQFITQKRNDMANAVNWFEIPAANFERAAKFYGEVMGSPLHQESMNGMEMGFFTHQQGGVGGAIVKGEGYVPSADGAMVYLNGGEDLSSFLAKVEPAGGKIVQPKTLITDEIGYMAIFLDPEGNKVAFHSPK